MLILSIILIRGYISLLVAQYIDALTNTSKVKGKLSILFDYPLIIISNYLFLLFNFFYYDKL